VILLKKNWIWQQSMQKIYLSVFKNFFEKLGNVLLADCSYSNPYLDIHRVNANHGRNLIISATTNINNLEQNVASQKLLVEKNTEWVRSSIVWLYKRGNFNQESKVKSAQANVSNYYALIEKTLFVLP